MLVLSRKVGEQVVIGDGITLTVNKINGNRVTLGIDAPKEVAIRRGELELEMEEVPAPTPRSAAPLSSFTSRTSGSMASAV